MVHLSFSLGDAALNATRGFVDGQWVTAKGGRAPFEVIDPATDEAWTECESMDNEDVDVAVAAALNAFSKWSKTPPRERARLILKLDSLVREARDDLSQLIVMETGKAKAEAEAEFDYALTYSWFCAGEAERLTGEMIPGAANVNTKFWTTKQPIGVVGLLCPWNFPLAITLRKVASALAAGCTMVLKPSPESPVTSLALGLLCQRAGIPNGVVNVITASYETTPLVGKRMCEHPDIAKISFTGSTEVGKLLMKQSSSTLKKLTLELGGNGGWIVFDDADLETSSDALIANKFRSAGQVCVCANRVFVQRNVMTKFVELVKTKMQKLKVGHGLDPGITTGPLTTKRGVERAVKLIEDAKARGGKILLGGERFGPGYHLQPTLIVDAPMESNVYTTEMFAPICSIYPFDTEAEVIEKVNATDMGLTNYVFTQNIGRAFRCSDALQSGNVALNMAAGNVAEAPFGGIKHSGMGKEGGIGHGVEEFMIVKATALNLG